MATFYPPFMWGWQLFRTGRKYVGPPLQYDVHGNALRQSEQARLFEEARTDRPRRRERRRRSLKKGS